MRGASPAARSRTILAKSQEKAISVNSTAGPQTRRILDRRIKIFSRNKGLSKAEIIFVAQEWLNNYKDDYVDSSPLDFFDDYGDEEE